MAPNALLIILIYYLVTTLDTFFLGWEAITRPIVIGPLTGLVLGDLKTGVLMGAVLESMFMGISAIGGSLAADPTTASVLAVAYAVLTGASREAALALALPIGTIMAGFRDALMPVFSAAAPYWERLAVKNLKSFTRQVIICTVTLYQLLPCLILYLCVTYGFELFGDPSAGGGEESWIIIGLTAGTYMLIAVGFAILGSMIISKDTIGYFFIGFLLAKALNLDTIVIALIGIIAAVLVFLKEKRKIDLQNNQSGPSADNQEDFF